MVDHLIVATWMESYLMSIYLVCALVGCVGLCVGRCVGLRCLRSQSLALRQESSALLLPKIGGNGSTMNVKVCNRLYDV